MRVWSLPPKYLDANGLTAGWREDCWLAKYFLVRQRVTVTIRSLRVFAK
jgi:hypothetical protein